MLHLRNRGLYSNTELEQIINFVLNYSTNTTNEIKSRRIRLVGNVVGTGKRNENHGKVCLWLDCKN